MKGKSIPRMSAVPVGFSHRAPTEVVVDGGYVNTTNIETTAAHAITFYGKSREVVEDGKTKTLLSELEEEERNHLVKIEGYLADMPPAPR